MSNTPWAVKISLHRHTPAPLPTEDGRCCLLKQNTKRIHRKDLFLKPIALQNCSTKLQFSPSGFEPLPITLGTTQTTITYTAPPPYAILERSTLINKNPKEKNQICLLFASTFWHPCNIKLPSLLFCLPYFCFPLSCNADWNIPRFIPSTFFLPKIFLSISITFISLIKSLVIIWHLNNHRITRVGKDL